MEHQDRTASLVIPREPRGLDLDPILRCPTHKCHTPKAHIPKALTHRDHTHKAPISRVLGSLNLVWIQMLLWVAQATMVEMAPLLTMTMRSLPTLDGRISLFDRPLSERSSWS